MRTTVTPTASTAAPGLTRSGPIEPTGSRDARSSTASAWLECGHGGDAGTHAGCAEAAHRFRRLRRARERQAGRLPRLGLLVAEAAPGARRDARVLRALVRERPPRRLHARRARNRGLRGCAREGTR